MKYISVLLDLAFLSLENEVAITGITSGKMEYQGKERDTVHIS